MGLGGVLSNLIAIGAKLRPSVNAFALQAPSSSSSSSLVREREHQIEAELEQLMRILERIKATLYDAEQREIRDASVKLFLTELKQVALKAEDVLDEHHYEVLRAQVEARDASLPDSSIQEKASDAKGSKQKEVAEESDESMTKVLDDLFAQIQQIRSIFAEIEKDRKALKLSDKDGHRLSNSQMQIAPTSYLVVESNIFGREIEKKELIDLLSSEGHDTGGVSVVTIVGMGGIGKTTLAQLAYNYHLTQQTFDKFGWVCVSEDFNVERLTKESLESITGTNCALTNLSALQNKILSEIKGKRVLLVLDDVWNEEESLWESFQAPFMSAKSAKILVTTRNDHVARIMRTKPTINLGSLSADHSWQLFKHYAFRGVKQLGEDPKFIEIGKQIIHKCGMLPLAVKSIANLLSYEVEENSWTEILESELWESNANNRIFPSLQISYIHLPIYLKPCLLYCSLFPKDNKYNVEHMVQLWISQGYVEAKGNKDAEKLGYEYVQHLIQRSFFEGIYEAHGLKPYFKLHDIIHDLAQLNSENSCYSIEVGKVPILPDKLYHLNIAPSVKLTKPLPYDKLAALRTLLLIISPDVYNYFCSFDFSKAQRLRTLELNCQPLKYPQTDDHQVWELEDFITSISNLKHLRYLSLDVLSIKTPPEFICSLYNLKILTLFECDFQELPTNIGNLVSLEELKIINCYNIEMLPESLCRLKALRKLIIHYNLLELPDNIGNLISLEELQISYCYHLKMLPESLCQLKVLRRLIVHACDCFLELPDNIGNLISLEELEINDCPNFVVLPESLCKLKILRKLHLIACKQLKKLPSGMEKLTNLQTLKFSGIGVSSLPTSLRKLRKLQTLNARLKCNTIGWLEDFSKNLQGALSLDGLANLSSLSDAQSANLASIDKLEYLILSWKKRIANTVMYKNKMFMEIWRRFSNIRSCPQNRHENVLKLSIQKSQKMIEEEDHNDFSVMVSLQPHSNLREFKVEGYGGNIFPEWIGNSSSCASLERIVIQWCQNLTVVPFGSLQKLKYLKICECDCLSFLTAESLPLELEELIIEKNNKLISMPGILKLKYLVKLCIIKCENLHSLVNYREQMIHTNEVSYQNTLSSLRSLTSLRSLKIGWCPKLSELVHVKPCKVEVWDCPKLKHTCLQHSIYYKDGEIRRDDIKSEEQEGEDLDTEGDDETEEEEDLDTGDMYETEEEEEEDMDTKDEFDAKEEVKEEEDEDLDLEDGFGLEPRRKNKRART